MSLTRRTFGAALTGAALAPSAVLPHPKLMVVAVAEQFRTDFIDAHPGGFQRLLSSAAFFPNCHLNSTSFTASGLATIATGAYPSVHGIVADRWFDRSGREVVQAKRELLEATTFASEFLAADKRNRAYGIGFDARTTEILCRPSEIVPSPNPSSKLYWTGLGAAKNAPPMRIIDTPNPREFVTLWRGSPFGQAAQMAHARELVTREKLGRGPGVDLLVIVLGALGTLGYETGADSPLMFDLVSHLDRELDTLLLFLDETLGEANFQFVFTAAHGAPHEPPNEAACRISGKEVAGAVGAGVEAYVYPFLYLRSGDPKAAALAAVKARKAVAWYTANGECSHTGAWRTRLENSFHAQRSGDVLLVYAPNCVEDFGMNRGISYGSIYNYDTQVPLILRGPQFRPGVYEQTVELIDVAPTLARATGTPAPSSSTGQFR